MDRLVLSDAAWERMAPRIICRLTRKGLPGAIVGYLWKVCCGSCVRALLGVIFPRRLADWNSVFRRFSRWSIKGVWWRSSGEPLVARRSGKSHKLTLPPWARLLSSFGATRRQDWYQVA